MYGCFQKKGWAPKMDGLFIVENPIKMDDLGVPLFLETPIYISQRIQIRLGASLNQLASRETREGPKVGPIGS